MKFRSLISNQIGKPVDVRESLLGRSTKWISQRFGVSLRQAQRYKSGKATLDRPQDRAKRERVMSSADADTRRKVAAEALRNARSAHVGRIEVVDKSPKKGRKPGKQYRNVGTVPLDRDEDTRRRIREAADALEAGDTARAEQLMSEAVLRTSGKDYGAALDVADWPAGFHLI